MDQFRALGKGVLGLKKVPKAVILMSDAPRHQYFSRGGGDSALIRPNKSHQSTKKEYYTSQLEPPRLKALQKK